MSATKPIRAKAVAKNITKLLIFEVFFMAIKLAIEHSYR